MLKFISEISPVSVLFQYVPRDVTYAKDSVAA